MALFDLLHLQHLPLLRKLHERPRLLDRADLVHAPARWQPLLTGSAAVVARERVRTIAGLFQNLEDQDAAIHADVALFLAQVAVSDGDASVADRALAYLSSAMRLIAETPRSPALYGGFTGIAWITGHLQRLLMPDDDTDLLSEIDGALLHLLRRPAGAHEDYDIISGLTGYGTYALSRRSADAETCIALVVEQLRDTAVTLDGGVAWFLPSRMLSADAAEATPDGRYDLGFAHGIAGVIAFLSAAATAPKPPKDALPLLDSAVRWLLAQQLPERAPSRFPSWIQPGKTSRPSRLGWCYGDLGISMALLRASAALSDASLRTTALTIAEAAAVRDRQSAAVTEETLCHGSSGIAHLFAQLFDDTGHDAFAQAAERWFVHATECVTPGTDASFLTGTTGTGLALLSAVSDVRPAWNGLLLAR